MLYNLKSYGNKDINVYAQFLYSRANEAKHIPFKSVLINGCQPVQNHCHHNVSKYVDYYTDSTAFYGWLCIDEKESGQIIFLSHSVVQDDLDVFDITPSNSIIPRPFIQSFLDDEVFVELVDGYKKTRLIYIK